MREWGIFRNEKRSTEEWPPSSLILGSTPQSTRLGDEVRVASYHTAIHSVSPADHLTRWQGVEVLFLAQARNSKISVRK